MFAAMQRSGLDMNDDNSVVIVIDPEKARRWFEAALARKAASGE